MAKRYVDIGMVKEKQRIGGPIDSIYTTYSIVFFFFIKMFDTTMDCNMVGYATMFERYLFGRSHTVQMAIDSPTILGFILSAFSMNVESNQSKKRMGEMLLSQIGTIVMHFSRKYLMPFVRPKIGYHV